MKIPFPHKNMDIRLTFVLLIKIAVTLQVITSAISAEKTTPDKTTANQGLSYSPLTMLRKEVFQTRSNKIAIKPTPSAKSGINLKRTSSQKVGSRTDSSAAYVTKPKPERADNYLFSPSANQDKPVVKRKSENIILSSPKVENNKAFNTQKLERFDSTMDSHAAFPNKTLENTRNTRKPQKSSNKRVSPAVLLSDNSQSFNGITSAASFENKNTTNKQKLQSSGKKMDAAVKYQDKKLYVEGKPENQNSESVSPTAFQKKLVTRKRIFIKGEIRNVVSAAYQNKNSAGKENVENADRKTVTPGGYRKKTFADKRKLGTSSNKFVTSAASYNKISSSPQKQTNTGSKMVTSSASQNNIRASAQRQTNTGSKMVTSSASQNKIPSSPQKQTNTGSKMVTSSASQNKIPSSPQKQTNAVSKMVTSAAYQNKISTNPQKQKNTGSNMVTSAASKKKLDADNTISGNEGNTVITSASSPKKMSTNIQKQTIDGNKKITSGNLQNNLLADDQRTGKVESKISTFGSSQNKMSANQLNLKTSGRRMVTTAAPQKKIATKSQNSGDARSIASVASQDKKIAPKEKRVHADSKMVVPAAYQNKIVADKPKPEKVESQEAPPDATSGLLTKHSSGKPKKVIFCYYGSSANSRPSLGKFWPEHIDPFLCTHLIFAFVDITEDGTGIKPNNWNDLGENGLYARTMKLKEKNPDLKILLAVGGWKIGSEPFIPIMKSEETWKKWVDNVIIYLRQYNFDGLDMDWEFPAWRGSPPEDREKFTLFMKDLYEGFAKESKSSGKERLLLTLATASSGFYAEKSYEQREIHKYIDYMLLMTYNYHGSGWEKLTGHHSPLLPHPLDPEGEQRELYALWSVKYWLNFGVPKEKVVLGLATYGLGWKLTDKSQTGVRAPADGGNTKGQYTEESGILSHYEICDKVINEGWKVKWIEEQKVPYAYGSGEWVGFDSPDSYYLKAATIIKEGLAGAFVWSVEMDDFTGHCGGPKYPLLRTIYETFTQSSPASASLISASASGNGHSSSAASGGGHSSSAASENGHSSSAASGSGHSSSAASGNGHISSKHKDDDEDKSDHKESSSEDNKIDKGSDKESDYQYTYYDSEDIYDAVDCDDLGLGIHPDPMSCHHFVLCMPLSHDHLGSSRMSCPSGTLYDNKLKVCNHEHQVECEL